MSIALVVFASGLNHARWLAQPVYPAGADKSAEAVG